MAECLRASQVTTLPGPCCAEEGGVAPGQVSMKNTHTHTNIHLMQLGVAFSLVVLLQKEGIST